MIGKSIKIGVALTLLSVAFVVFAYPQPLFGNMSNGLVLFEALFLSAIAFLVAILGGVLLVRDAAKAQDEILRRLSISVVGPVGTAALITGYLVVFAGFGLRGWLIVGSFAVAILAGVVAAFVE